MGNALETASCCTDAENPGRAERTTEFPPQLKVGAKTASIIHCLQQSSWFVHVQVQLSARRHADLPPGQVVNVSPRTAKKFTQSGFPIVESCSDTVDSQADTGESADNVNDLQAKPINPKIPLMAFRYDFPPGARRQHWKLSAMEETVGVGAHFEATQSGAIKVRGLSKGSPADQSGLFSIGDELIEVDGVKAFGRPLSELGQYVLGNLLGLICLLLLALLRCEAIESLCRTAAQANLALRCGWSSVPAPGTLMRSASRAARVRTLRLVPASSQLLGSTTTRCACETQRFQRTD